MFRPSGSIGVHWGKMAERCCGVWDCSHLADPKRRPGPGIWLRTETGSGFLGRPGFLILGGVFGLEMIPRWLFWAKSSWMFHGFPWWCLTACRFQPSKVVIPESKGPTWDYLLTCQRKDRVSVRGRGCRANGLVNVGQRFPSISQPHADRIMMISDFHVFWFLYFKININEHWLLAISIF
jgi:hypothetical protein